MNKSETVRLTKSLIEKITPKEIIYAEIAGGGAMGNEGGIILYLIKDYVFVRYEVNVFSDEEVYLLAEELILKHQEGLFNKIYGGMGNYVFVNKNTTLEIKDEYFVYRKGNNEYQILASVLGVFDNVAYAIKNNNKEYI